ncbi:MAG TPA: PLP-dependent aminotransferase family protein [Gaiellaceae bacterium]|nr:PLP-dependent aminotransferase family protein [Gaiellaceae bacterium]
MGTISFARGAPAPECLPAEELADCARAAVANDPAVLGYGPAGGYGPLREWVAERHGVAASRVALTNGSLQGFLFYARRQLEARGARVLVEAPTYDRPLTLLATLGADVEAVPQDDDGLDLDALEDALGRGPSPAFLYTIPTFQNPSGRTLPADRRRRLVELARAHGLPVLEDDPYGLVRFEGDAPPTLLELEGGRLVAYTSSFSKTVAPGLRVGYFVLPDELVAPFEAAALATYITPALLGEATVWEFVRRGRFEPNLDRVRGLLRTRRDAMLDALARELGEAARWSRPEGGYFLWIDFGEGVDAAELLRRATEAGVPFVRGSDFFPGGADGRSEARLAFSFASPDEIGEGIARLAGLLPVRV